MTEFSAYIMLCGSNEVPEQVGLTKDECAAVLMETCENYEVDKVLHVYTVFHEATDITNEYVSYEVDDVTEDMFSIPYNANVDGSDPEDFTPNPYKGRLGEMIDQYIEWHPSTIEAGRGDYERDRDGER